MTTYDDRYELDRELERVERLVCKLAGRQDVEMRKALREYSNAVKAQDRHEWLSKLAAEMGINRL